MSYNFQYRSLAPHLLNSLITKYFIFGTIITRIASLILLSGYLFTASEEIHDWFLHIDIASYNLANLVSSNSIFLVNFLGFSVSQFMLFPNRDSFTPSFPIWILLFIFLP